MKLINFKINDNYIFDLEFENNIMKNINLSELIQDKVTIEDLKTANIDKDWGCLEFKSGMVDIEPKTLYNFAIKEKQKW